MKSKVIIVRSVNITPEEELKCRLDELAGDWEIVSAETVMQVFGVGVEPVHGGPPLYHCHYVTTVVVKSVVS